MLLQTMFVTTYRHGEDHRYPTVKPVIGRNLYEMARLLRKKWATLLSTSPEVIIFAILETDTYECECR
jgi:hypothetical protein